MNEQLQQALTELITKATTGIDSASEFMLAELPEVIQQLIMWRGVLNGVKFMASVFIFMVLIIVDFKIYKYAKNMDRTGVFDEVDIVIVSAIGNIIVGVFATFSFNLTWLQIWIAPKVWLIEYAANLVK